MGLRDPVHEKSRPSSASIRPSLAWPPTSLVQARVSGSNPFSISQVPLFIAARSSLRTNRSTHKIVFGSSLVVVLLVTLLFATVSFLSGQAPADNVLKQQIPAQTQNVDKSQATVPPFQPTQLPQLVDITASTKIKFDHLASPEQKYIVESMSGGVALIDYDRDGWPDIFLPTVPA